MQPFFEKRSERIFIGGMTHFPYPLHVHEIVELVCVLRGTCEIRVGGANYTLQKGDIAIAFPLVPHGYDRLSPDIDGLVAFFPPETIGEFASLFDTMLPLSPVLRAEQVGPDAMLAIERLTSMPDDAPFPSRLAFLHLLLADVIDRLQLLPASALSEREMTYRVTKYIYDHACEALTLATTAWDLGISESRLSHLFSQRFRVNFRQFINAIRIDKAIALMYDPEMTLTAIYDRCGFGNMRTFRRAFVRETGMLPTEYLRELRHGELREKEKRAGEQKPTMPNA